MDFKLYARGDQHIAFAPVESDVFAIDSVAESRRDLEDSFDSLMKKFLDAGRIPNSNRFGSLGNGIHELKPGQLRVPYFHHNLQVVVLTHAFVKKKQKTPRQELAKAQEVREAWKIWSETQHGKNSIRAATG